MYGGQKTVYRLCSRLDERRVLTSSSLNFLVKQNKQTADVVNRRVGCEDAQVVNASKLTAICKVVASCGVGVVVASLSCRCSAEGERRDRQDGRWCFDWGPWLPEA